MARPRNNISIYTISEQMGLSPATISKALNDYPQVSAKTRELVRRTAEEMGFSITPVSKNVPNICCVIQRAPSAPINFKPFIASVLEGLASYCWSKGLEASLYGGDFKELNKRDLVRELLKRKADGAIFVNADQNSKYLKKVHAQKFPYICLLTADADSNERRLLQIDDTELARKAANFLIQLGHRKIIAIVSNAKGQTGRARLAGFKTAFKSANLEHDPNLIIHPADDSLGGLGSGYALVTNMLHKFPEATALYTMDQNIAMGATRALLSMGVKVPEEFSVICCDDCEYHEFFTPSITSVSIPNEKLAYHAAEWVHRLIEGQTTLRQEYGEPWMRGELIVRESTGSARQGLLKLKNSTRRH